MSKTIIITRIKAVVRRINDDLLIVQQLYTDTRGQEGIPNTDLLALIIENGKPNCARRQYVALICIREVRSRSSAGLNSNGFQRSESKV